jgi:hypothetical protein
MVLAQAITSVRVQEMPGQAASRTHWLHKPLISSGLFLSAYGAQVALCGRVLGGANVLSPLVP